MRKRWLLLGVGIASLGGGCLDDGPVAAGRGAASVSLRMVARVEGLAAAEADVQYGVDVRVAYRLANGTSVPIETDLTRPIAVAAASGELEASEFVVRIAECLRDPRRENAAAGGCRLVVTLDLVDDDGVALARSSQEPATPAHAGRSVELSPFQLRPWVRSIVLEPAPASIASGSTHTFRASPRDAAGRPLVGRTVRWAVSDADAVRLSAATSVSTADGATVTGTGVRAGAAPVTVTATNDDDDAVRADAVVRVSPGAPALVSLSFAPSFVPVGESATAVAVVRDANGNVVPDASVNWQSVMPGTATIERTGDLTARVTVLKEGPFRVEAAVSGHPEVRSDADGEGRPTPTFVVRIEGGGAGRGRVTSNVASLDCAIANGIAARTGCSGVVPGGTVVELTAVAAAPGHGFVGWSGAACTGSTCTFRVDADRTVAAVFRTPTSPAEPPTPDP